MSRGEDLVTAVKREVNEETGLSIAVVKLLDVAKKFHKDHYDVLFDFEAVPASSKLSPTEKLVELKWFSKKELKKLRITRRDEKILNKF